MLLLFGFVVVLLLMVSAVKIVSHWNILYNSYFMALAVGSVGGCGAVVGLVLGAVVLVDFFSFLDGSAIGMLGALAVFGENF